MADADRCVICGAIIPEGRMICPTCERGVKPAFRGAKLPPSLKGMQVDKELAKAEICGTCKYHVPMPLEEWFCDNKNADAYGCETEYSDSCEEWEER